MKRLSVNTSEQQKLLGEDVSFDESLLTDLSGLLNESKKDIIEDCYFFQIKKLMGQIAEVNVRFDLSDNKLAKILKNADVMSMNEVLLPPVYLPSSKKITQAEKLSYKYSALIDFPFGESSFLAKKYSVKESVKQNVKSITVTLPTVLMANENIKDFRKQIRKIGVMADVPIGVLLNATDMTDEQVKDSIKKIEKTKIDFITFAFGDSNSQFIRERMNYVMKCSKGVKINILGNIDRADIVKELIALNINIIYTPYADEIAKEILEHFKIKKVKLL